MPGDRSLGITAPVLLNLHRLDDPKLEALVEGLASNSKTAPLCTKFPDIQKSIDSAATDWVIYAKARTALNLVITQLPMLRKTVSTTRATVLRDINQARTQVETNGTSPQDVTDVGFATPDTGTVKQPDTIPKPDGVEFRPGKHKYTIPRVAVIDGRHRQHFACEISGDPFGPATFGELAGMGKVRKIQGYASGTVLWVRFAALLGGKRSDWCDPLRIVVP